MRKIRKLSSATAVSTRNSNCDMHQHTERLTWSVNQASKIINFLQTTDSTYSILSLSGKSSGRTRAQFRKANSFPGSLTAFIVRAMSAEKRRHNLQKKPSTRCLRARQRRRPSRTNNSKTATDETLRSTRKSLSYVTYVIQKTLKTREWDRYSRLEGKKETKCSGFSRRLVIRLIIDLLFQVSNELDSWVMWRKGGVPSMMQSASREVFLLV